jgi:hypothetical protein
VGGDLDIKADAQLPALTSVGGDLDIKADIKLTAPLLPYVPAGDLTAFKKCQNGIIVKLHISASADRVGLSTGKCRASQATVINIEGAIEVRSNHDSSFVYRIGETVHVNDFEKRLKTCAAGIHFFLTREQAVAY